MAKKKRGKIVSKRTRTVSTPYTRPKTPEAGPSHRHPVESRPSGSGYELTNQESYPNSPEPQSATDTDSFVENEPRPSGSEYGLPNQESYQDSPEPRSTILTNPVVDNVSAEFYKSDDRINIQRMHSMRAPLLESSTVPSCSTPAMTANIEVILASCRKRKSVQKSSDSESPQNDPEDTTPKKRVQFETNISFPVSKIPTSTRVTSATTPSSDVLIFSPPIKIKTPVSSQSPSCSSEEQVQPKFTFSPATSIIRRPPIYSSSNTSSTTVTSSATTSCSIMVKAGILSKGSTSKVKKRVQFILPVSKIPKVTSTRVTSATTSSSDVFTFSPPIKIKIPVSGQSPSCSSEEQVQPKFTFSPPASITRRPPIYSSSNISSTTVTYSATTSCSVTFKAGILSKGSTSKAKKRVQFILPVSKIPKVTSTRVTSATTSSSDVFTFSPPIKIKIPVSIQNPSCISTFQPSCFSVPTTSTAQIESTKTPQPIKSWTRPFKQSSRNTFKNSPSTSSTPATHTTPEPFRIGQETNTPPAPSQSPLFSSTFQPSCFSMPITSTASIESTETTQPIKSWTRPFKQSSRNTLKNSPSTSSKPATHTPSEPFRIGQETNTPPAPSQRQLFSSTFQPSCFSMPTTSTASMKSWTRPFKQSSRNTFKNSPSTSSTPATYSPPEPFRIDQETNTPPAPSQSPLFSSTFQPSCFSMPITSTASIESTETPQPIKSWTRPFKQSSRNTFTNSPGTSSTPATYTPPEPFRIDQWTNTLPAPSQNLLFSSTLQSSSFTMGQDSAGTSQQPSPYSAASNLDQQSSSRSSTVPSKKQ